MLETLSVFLGVRVDAQLRTCACRNSGPFTKFLEVMSQDKLESDIHFENKLHIRYKYFYSDAVLLYSLRQQMEYIVNDEILPLIMKGGIDASRCPSGLHFWTKSALLLGNETARKKSK